MKRILIVCLMIATVVACNKDKFQTKPQIKVKNTETETIQPQSSLAVVLEYTDKEGDVSDSVIFVRQRINWRSPRKDTTKFKIPTFPNSRQGEIVMNLDYVNFLTRNLPAITIPGTGSKKEADTLNLKFVVLDKAGNKSDTASKNVIVIRL